MALATLGEPEDMADLERLINADIERVRQGRSHVLEGAQRAGQRGCHEMVTWYVRSVFWLDPTSAEGVLLQLLSEPEYELDAAKAGQARWLRDFESNAR